MCVSMCVQVCDVSLCICVFSVYACVAYVCFCTYNVRGCVYVYVICVYQCNVFVCIFVHDLCSFAFQEGIKKNKLNVYIPENKVINIRQN